MSKKSKLAPFAHLLGMSRAEDKEDEEKKGRRAEKDEEEKEKGKRASEKEKDEEEAEEKDEDEHAEEHEEEEEEEEEKDGKKGKKAKKAKRAEDDEDDVDAEESDDEDEMRGSSAAACARRRERARCKAIFSCAAAGARPDVAASLAFDTNLTRKEAIKVLTTTAAGSQPRRGRIDERMASVRVAQVHADSGDAPNANLSPVAAAIIAAGEKARGK